MRYRRQILHSPRTSNLANISLVSLTIFLHFHPLTKHHQLDSGATQVFLPTIMAKAIAAQFKPPAVFNATIQQYSVPCNAKAPWFAIKIGGVIFPVDKRDMIIDDGTGSGTCAAGTNDGSTEAPYIIGDTFMNNVMAVFDVGSAEMKFRSR